MPVDGVDYSWGRPDVYQLAAQGYEFVCRYLSYDTTGKNLSYDELVELSDAGLGVVLNWEYDPQAPLYGYEWGIGDAQVALQQANDLGCPDDCPIYFSVDFDAQPGQMDTIAEYFAGVATVIDLDRVGVYGSYDVIEHAANHGWATWFWQTYAWSGGKQHPAAHIYQHSNGEVVAGAEVDLNHGLAVDIGAWNLTTDHGGDDGGDGDSIGDVAGEVWAYPVAADDPSLAASVVLTETYVATTTTMPDQLDALTDYTAALKSQLEIVESKVDQILSILTEQTPDTNPDTDPDPCAERVGTALRDLLTKVLPKGG